MEGDAHDGDELEISRDTATNQVSTLATSNDATAELITPKGVFVYKPKQSKADGERPSKRRKVSSANAFKGGGSLPFVPLLNGREGSTTVQLRHQAYKDLWAEQDAKIQVGGTRCKSLFTFTDSVSFCPGDIGRCRLGSSRKGVLLRRDSLC